MMQYYLFYLDKLVNLKLQTLLLYWMIMEYKATTKRPNKINCKFTFTNLNIIRSILTEWTKKETKASNILKVKLLILVKRWQH